MTRWARIDPDTWGVRIEGGYAWGGAGHDTAEGLPVDVTNAAGVTTTVVLGAQARKWLGPRGARTAIYYVSDQPVHQSARAERSQLRAARRARSAS